MENIKEPIIKSPIQTECPADNMRKTATSQPSEMPITVDDDGTWHISGFSEVRQILRNDIAAQAGFAAEKALEGAGTVMKNPPILYLEGEEHHKARRETNKFFTPSITNREYRDFMNAFADSLIEQLKTKKQLDLSDLSMEMAVQVAAQIVGLTDSYFEQGLKSRLEALITTGDDYLKGELGIINTMKANWRLLSFYFCDVRPAIRKRREQAQEDVISYLISRDYADFEIVTECIVYGVAGMVTTREFICVVLWHLMENEHLKERMRVGSEKERYAILHEILRLEPVVSHIHRRTTQELTIESQGETVTIPAGTKLDLNISMANVDTTVMGDNSLAVCPAREVAEMRPKVADMGLSFGDGSHRCPGAYVAIQETDIFIRKLLDVPNIHIEQKPNVDYLKVIEGYELRNFIISVD